MNPPANPKPIRYRIVISTVPETEPVFDEECDAYIVGIGDDYPTSITMLVDHRGPWRLREVLVEEIEHAVLGHLT